MALGPGSLVSDPEALAVGLWWRHGWRWRTSICVLAAAWVIVILAMVSVAGALAKSGSESFSAKWAAVLRDNHAGFVVPPFEGWLFTSAHPAGDRPRPSNRSIGIARPADPTTVPTTVPPAPTTTVPRHLPVPRNVEVAVDPPLDNEGRWTAAGPTVGGVPGMYTAQFRADGGYPSQITTAAWIDPLLFRVRLNPGDGDPGGSWSVPPVITGDALSRVVAAFNGGFRFKDAQGGFYLDGHAAVALRDGAASIVISNDGHLDIGKWGSDVNLAENTEAVLQNLTLLVDGGQVDPSVSHNDNHVWGATLGGRPAVARSGVGVTSDGALVYVAGPALTARALAESLQRAGAVRAMTLDINPLWVTFNLFDHPDPNNPMAVTAAKLNPEMTRPAERYLTTENRAFFTIERRD